ncbi:MAG: hypothetical protein GY737_27840 [Desulfobacteraceae bacterium]|nr:hypothetical protein [Desulfobacteraceae bacterium]
MDEVPKKDGKDPVVGAGESMNTEDSSDQPEEDTAPAGIEEPDTGSLHAPKNVDDFYSNDPEQIIRNCLTQSFSDPEDIGNFCFEYSDELHKEIRNTDKFATIVRKIIQHCNTNDCHDQLWQSIKAKRPNQFIKYHAMWEKSKHKARNPKIHQFNTRIEFVKDDVTQNKESQSHPLSGDDDSAILNWFYNDLDEDEKSMVITVGLFQGLNRKYMPPISDAIKQILFETSDSRKGV